MNLPAGFRSLSALLPAFLLTLFASGAQAQFQPPAGPGSAASIPQAALIQPQQLNAMLAKPARERPVVLQVGSHLMFGEAHIPGSKYAGPGSQQAGIELLRQTVKPLAKNTVIVLYCGCCPWERCPNVAPAFQELRAAGFTNVRVLYLAHNFGDDWVARGFSVEQGR